MKPKLTKTEAAAILARIEAMTEAERAAHDKARTDAEIARLRKTASNQNGTYAAKRDFAAAQSLYLRTAEDQLLLVPPAVKNGEETMILGALLASGLFGVSAAYSDTGTEDVQSFTTRIANLFEIQVRGPKLSQRERNIYIAILRKIAEVNYAAFNESELRARLGDDVPGLRSGIAVSLKAIIDAAGIPWNSGKKALNTYLAAIDALFRTDVKIRELVDDKPGPNVYCAHLIQTYALNERDASKTAYFTISQEFLRLFVRGALVAVRPNNHLTPTAGAIADLFAFHRADWSITADEIRRKIRTKQAGAHWAVLSSTTYKELADNNYIVLTHGVGEDKKVRVIDRTNKHKVAKFEKTGIPKGWKQVLSTAERKAAKATTKAAQTAQKGA